MMRRTAASNPPRTQWYGTIGEAYVRQRDGIATRKRGFVLPVDLITRLEVFCVQPKQNASLIVERAVAEFLDREERKRSKAG